MTGEADILNPCSPFLSPVLENILGVHIFMIFWKKITEGSPLIRKYKALLASLSLEKEYDEISSFSLEAAPPPW